MLQKEGTDWGLYGINAQHIVPKNLFKNFSKKLLHLYIRFAIITFARLREGLKTAEPSGFQKTSKKVLKKFLTR